MCTHVCSVYMCIDMQMSVHLWSVLRYTCGVYICSIREEMSMCIYLFMSTDTWCVMYTLGSWIGVCFMHVYMLGSHCESTVVWAYLSKCAFTSRVWSPMARTPQNHTDVIKHFWAGAPLKEGWTRWVRILEYLLRHELQPKVTSNCTVKTHLFLPSCPKEGEIRC